MRKTNLLLFALVVTFSTLADMPPPPPSDLEVWSENEKYVATLKYEENKTSIFRVSPDGSREKMWEMDGWFRWTQLSNDGEYLAIPYRGANLIPVDYDKEEIMLTLVQRGQITTTIRLVDLIEKFSNLRRTVSHYSWGSYVGFNEENEFVIDTVENNRFLVPPKDGEVEKKMTPTQVWKTAQYNWAFWLSHCSGILGIILLSLITIRIKDNVKRVVGYAIILSLMAILITGLTIRSAHVKWTAIWASVEMRYEKQAAVSLQKESKAFSPIICGVTTFMYLGLGAITILVVRKKRNSNHH